MRLAGERNDKTDRLESLIFLPDTFEEQRILEIMSQAVLGGHIFSVTNKEAEKLFDFQFSKSPTVEGE